MPQDDQLERLCAGEAEACEQFVRTYATELYGWLYRLTGCREEAEDLTQEAFAAFWASLQRKKPPVAGRIWLFSIARNLWRQHCRRKGRQLVQESDPNALASIPAREQPAAEVLEQYEMRMAVQDAVAGLDADLREVFALRVWHDLDYAAIAAIQGIRPGLARWRFFRARQLVRTQIEQVFTEKQKHDA